MGETTFDTMYIKGITANAERSKSNSHRLDKVENDVEELKKENKLLYSITNSDSAPLILFILQGQDNSRQFSFEHNQVPLAGDGLPTLAVSLKQPGLFLPYV